MTRRAGDADSRGRVEAARQPKREGEPQAGDADSGGGNKAGKQPKVGGNEAGR